jgi:hypothetical protein
MAGHHKLVEQHRESKPAVSASKKIAVVSTPTNGGLVASPSPRLDRDFSRVPANAGSKAGSRGRLLKPGVTHQSQISLPPATQGVFRSVHQQDEPLATISPSVQRQVRTTINESGRPLEPGIQRFLEPRFGKDFSHVRMHTSEAASRSAAALNAAAYTVGQHVAFGEGQYAPITDAGLRLIAHELSHVVPLPPGHSPIITRVAHPASMEEIRARESSRMLGLMSQSPHADKSGVVYRQPLTPEHEELRASAARHSASPLQFTVSDAVKWKTDPDYLDLFKDNFVFENRKVILSAATKYDIPAELLAGIVRIEIGGKDPIKPLVYQWRKWVPFTRDKDQTSLGQQAMQPRRAAESLGYDPKALTEGQHEEIIKTLEDPSQSIFLAAKHLSDLRNVDFKGTAGSVLTLEQIEIIGARYNRGPTLPLGEIKKNLSYGRAITGRWGKLQTLLISPPRHLQYLPPGSRSVAEFERNIYRLYGVPGY